MDKSNCSQLEQNSLGILSMENLKVFGDSSSYCASERASSRGSSSVNERLQVERQRALETLGRPRMRQSSTAAESEKHRRNGLLRMSDNFAPRRRENGENIVNNNISELITDDTIDLNSSGSFALPTPKDGKGSNISFEAAEITGRSTLCQSDKSSSRRGRTSTAPKKVISVADILKTSFVEKARLLETKLQQTQANANSTASSLMESFSCSRSLPRTADMSQHSNVTLNGGVGFSFSSAGGQQFNESNFSAAAGFAPAELMQSRLVQGEISWAQEFAAMPAATLSKQAMEKAAAPARTIDIEASVTNSVIADDPDFSVGNFFKLRSETIWNIVSSASGIAEQTPKPDNKTYTKAESAQKLERHMLKAKQQDKINNALQTNQQRNSELLSLSAINKALHDLNLDTDTSSADVVHKLKTHCGSRQRAIHDEEDKENSEPTLAMDKSQSRQHADTISFSESLLNSTDFINLQQSLGGARKPLSPLAQPEILVTQALDDREHDADVDEWPSTPVKSPDRRVRRTKSPAATGVEIDADKTPVNKQRSLASSRNPTSLSSTRLDGCEAPPSTTDCDFGISPNLGRSVTLTSRNVSPLSSPRSCLSSPLLDSTTSSERRQLMPSAAARKANSSPAGSEPRQAGSQLSTAARSMSRCSSSSEFSHRDGKLLPLKVTHTSLCWGSTKLRTDVRKSMQVKNTADKRLVVRLGIHGPGFQLATGDGNTITLQAMECRTVSLNFCPTVCGAAIGALSFYAPLGANNCHQAALELPLYGYGGNAALSIQGLLKGPVGASFLTMGDVGDLSSGPLTASFRFCNKGPLSAYADISLDSTVLMKPRLNAAFEVRPSKVIIPAQSEAVVQIVFRPNRDDVKNMLKKLAPVLTLANMRIFCGDEPNRQRMRSLVQRMDGKQRERLTSSMLDSIWCRFPDEQPIRHIATLNEPPEYILDLVTSVRIVDVALTLNRDIDESAETSLPFMPEADETVLFRTICAASSPTPTQCNILEPVDELLEADTTCAAEQQSLERHWSVQPTALQFDLCADERAVLYIKNCFKSRQYFEVSCNVENLLQFRPNEVYVAPDGGQVEISIHCSSQQMSGREISKKHIFIVVSMENERIHVPVTFNV